MNEFRRLKNERLSDDELRRAKDQLRGNILLGLESSTSRMSNLARQEMYFEYFFSMKEVIDMVEKRNRRASNRDGREPLQAGERSRNFAGPPEWSEGEPQPAGTLAEKATPSLPAIAIERKSSASEHCLFTFASC